jgi:hypothetical protein
LVAGFVHAERNTDTGHTNNSFNTHAIVAKSASHHFDYGNCGSPVNAAHGGLATEIGDLWAENTYHDVSIIENETSVGLIGELINAFINVSREEIHRDCAHFVDFVFGQRICEQWRRGASRGPHGSSVNATNSSVVTATHSPVVTATHSSVVTATNSSVVTATTSAVDTATSAASANPTGKT